MYEQIIKSNLKICNGQLQLIFIDREERGGAPAIISINYIIIILLKVKSDIKKQAKRLLFFSLSLLIVLYTLIRYVLLTYYKKYYIIRKRDAYRVSGISFNKNNGDDDIENTMLFSAIKITHSTFSIGRYTLRNNNKIIKEIVFIFYFARQFLIVLYIMQAYHNDNIVTYYSYVYIS